MVKNPVLRILAVLVAVGAGVFALASLKGKSPPTKPAERPESQLDYKPRMAIDVNGFTMLLPTLEKWRDDAPLTDIAKSFDRLGFKGVARLDQTRATRELPTPATVELLVMRAGCLGYEGQTKEAYKNLEEARAIAEADPSLAEHWLYTVIYCQGVLGLRQGEDENCILCRGESSCIVPIAAAAVHTKPAGSRLAIHHFTEYLAQFPDDLGVRWLLNVAHMTLGEFPAGVDAKYLLPLDGFFKSEFNIGRFRDIGDKVGVNRFNQAGGAIMDDFFNDGWLDLITTTMDATQSMAFYRNKGDGTFEDRTSAAGLSGQLGGLYCVQTDYNNDGKLDVFVCRGAWMPYPMRPSLLRNDGNGTFTDVTVAAGLDAPVNSISATWADFDNDGHLDLFVCCEQQPNKLYRNKGNGTFEDVAARAGVAGQRGLICKGATWIDYDNDGWPDLFINHLNDPPRLYHNNRNGTFTDVTAEMGIDGPDVGFACWAFDFDNDGYPDIFATSYDRTLNDVVKSLIGQPHSSKPSKLYRNLGGKRFQDVTKETGLDQVFVTMGCNFADFDNDGYLDFYLGTGDPGLGTLVPNRMFKNVGGKRFADISGSSGTAHLQKGHAVSCGDWDRDGNVDLFIQMGGAINGDKYHNILFQNPGSTNHWLNVKLVGVKSNRAAIGARIKAVTAGPEPLTVHRTVSSGSSFGANTLEQTLGLGKADRIAVLEIYWPTSGTTQTFRDVPADQAIEVTEFAKEYRVREWKRIALPK